MIGPDRRWGPPAAALLVLAVGCGVVWVGQSRAVVRRSSAALVPSAVGPWMGTVLPVDRRAVELLETEDVALMEYRAGEQLPVWLTQVAGFGTRAAFHPPELCYIGSHFEVMERGPMTVEVNGKPRRIMRLVVSQDGRRYEAWYWFTANGRVTPNYYQQQLWLVLDSIARKPMAGTLVRISTPLEAPEASRRRLREFLTAFEAGGVS